MCFIHKKCKTAPLPVPVVSSAEHSNFRVQLSFVPPPYHLPPSPLHFNFSNSGPTISCIGIHPSSALALVLNTQLRYYLF